MLKQLEEMTRLIRVLTDEANANLHQSLVPDLLVSIDYAAKTKDGKIYVRREKLIKALETREVHRILGIGRSTRISIIKWLLDNPA